MIENVPKILAHLFCLWTLLDYKKNNEIFKEA